MDEDDHSSEIFSILSGAKRTSQEQKKKDEGGNERLRENLLSVQLCHPDMWVRLHPCIR